MEEIFKTSQEGARKDIERAFGVLLKRFQYLKRPLRHWYIKDIKNILHCCIIMHNMIVECRRNEYMAATNGIDLPLPKEDQDEQEVPCQFHQPFWTRKCCWPQNNLAIHAELPDWISTVWGNVEDREKYNNLRSDLM
jgi:hypothetical protein